MLERGLPPASARAAGDPRPPPLPRVTRRRRSPRPSASRPAPRDRDSITPIAPCVPPSRRTPGPRSMRPSGMNHERDIERLLDHWLAEGPTVVADRVIDVIADRVERRSQRPAWRLRLAERWVDVDLRFVSVLTGVVVAVGMVGFSLGGGFASPSNPPSPAATTGPTTTPTGTHRATPTPRPQVPLTNRFTSAMNHYSISYPDGWTVRQATATYRWGSSLSIHDPTVDVLSAPGGRTALYIVSVAIPEGVTDSSLPVAQLLRPRPRPSAPRLTNDSRPSPFRSEASSARPAKAVARWGT